MFKNKKNIIVVVASVVVVFVSIYSVNANNIEPGSSADPVVTKGYVDEKINEFLTILNNGGNIGTSQTQSLLYKPVRATKGQSIICNEGTEIILRSGIAVGVSNGENGIVNATSGKEIFNNNNIEKNNLLIIPRTDGRGVKVTSDEAWFIIKGEHQIKN